jgi:anti-anti-sigma factor
MLNVTIQHSEDMAVLRCVGRIVAGDEADILRKAVLSQANRRTVVLDLTRVDAIDGGGMGVLLFLQGWARATEVDLKLMNPTSRVRELFELTNLDSVFEIFSSEDAVSSRPVAVASTHDTAAFQREH